MEITAIILAGGQSKRMGTNKALVEYLGKQLIGYSIELSKAFASEVIISSGEDELRKFGYPVVSDIFPVKAPLAGIHAGLTHSRTDWNLVLTCDMPHVSKEIIRFLMTYLDGEQQMIVPGHDGFVEPLCGFYNKNLLDLIEVQFKKQKYSPLDLISHCKSSVIPFDEIFQEPLSLLFKNVNERKDLK